MAGAIAGKLESIRKTAALNDSEIAKILDTTPQTLWRWRQGRRQQASLRDRLIDLEWITERLSSVYEPEDIKLWLHSRHELLHGDKPVDRIREGRVREVLELVEQLRTGSYI